MRQSTWHESAVKPISSRFPRAVAGDIADLADRVADQFVDGFTGERRLGCDFAGDHGEVGGDQGLAGDAAEGIVGKAEIEDRIGDLIGHLVRVPHRNGFAGEEVAVSGHGILSSSVARGGQRINLSG